MWHHIGCGRIGLGLIIPKFMNSDIEFKAYDRNKEKVKLINNEGYFLNKDKLFIKLNDLDEIEVKDGDVISTSVGPDNVNCVLKIINDNMKKKINLKLVPFENLDLSNKLDLFPMINITIVNSVIDRVVTRLDRNNVTSEKWEGFIAIDDNHGVKTPFNKEIVKIKSEKLKSVNGSHLLIGLLGMKYNFKTVEEFISGKPKLFNEIISICSSDQTYITPKKLESRLRESASKDKIDRLCNNLGKKFLPGERFELNKKSNKDNSLLIEVEKFYKEEVL